MTATHEVHASLIDRNVMKGQPPVKSVRKTQTAIVGVILVPSRFFGIEGRLNNGVIEIVGDFCVKISLGERTRVLNEARLRDPS